MTSPYEKTAHRREELRLDRPRITGVANRFAAQFFFYFPLLLLGVSSAFGCFYTAFPIPLSLKAVIPFGLFVCATASGLFLFARRRPLFFFSILSVWGFFLYRFFDAFLEGLIRTANIVLAAYSKKSKFDFAVLPHADAYPPADACTMFAVLLLVPTAILLAWLLIRRKSFFLGFALTLLFAAVPLAYTIIPHRVAMGALLLFWTFLLFNSPSLCAREQMHRQGHAALVSFGAKPAPGRLLLLPILAGALAIVFLLFPPESYQRPDAVNHVRGELVKKPLLAPLFQNDRLGEMINGIDLRSLGNLSFTGKTVLRVRTSGEGPEYLKGHVGSVYTGQSWEPLGAEASTEAEQILGSYKAQNLFAVFSSMGSIAPETYQVSVENISAAPRGIYVPYGLLSTPEQLPDMVFVDDAYVRAGNLFFVAREYELRAVPAGPPYSPSASAGPAPFLAAAAAYKEFVYRHYCQLPDNLQPYLEQYLLQHGIPMPQSDPRAAAAAIIQAVHRENVYTLSPGGTPEGQDFVQYFLSSNHKGYCMHFASAVTALLRAAGIPARFVQGYALLSEESGNPEKWVEIPDSRAHAWPEIYVDGLGWIPVEATPGGGAPVPPAAGLATEIDLSASSPPSEETDGASSSESASEASRPGTGIADSPETKASLEDASAGSKDNPKSESGDESRSTGFFRVFLFFLAVLLLGALIWGQRFLRLRLRNKAFSQRDGNRAALSIYAHLLALNKYAQRHLPDWDGLPESVTALWLKARYSQHSLTGDEITQLLDYDVACSKKLRQTLPLVPRIICQYIDALL